MTYDRETLSLMVKYNWNMKVDTDIGKGGKNTTVSRPVGDCHTLMVGPKHLMECEVVGSPKTLVTSYQENLKSCIIGINTQ
jgi:hypothetical protein